jgi:hypothetical protein
MEKPPNNLVCLDFIKPSKWLGLTVWHPHHIIGYNPFWLDDDSGEYQYDIGTIKDYSLEHNSGSGAIARITIDCKGISLTFDSNCLFSKV